MTTHSDEDEALNAALADVQRCVFELRSERDEALAALETVRCIVKDMEIASREWRREYDGGRLSSDGPGRDIELFAEKLSAAAGVTPQPPQDELLPNNRALYNRNIFGQFTRDHDSERVMDEVMRSRGDGGEPCLHNCCP